MRACPGMGASGELELIRPTLREREKATMMMMTIFQKKRKNTLSRT